MNLSAHSLAHSTFVPMLRTLSTWLDKGVEHAKKKGFDPAVLVSARLAPDMYPLLKQVQTACDNAKGAVARITGKEPPVHADDEKTIEDLKARIDKTVKYIESLPAEAFAGSEERDVAMPLQPPMVLEMKGGQYLCDWSLPNFYFHVVTAYDILRHSGVELGKRDYLSHVAGSIKQRST